MPNTEATPAFTDTFLQCFPNFREKHPGIPQKRFFENRMRETLERCMKEVGTIYKWEPNKLTYTKEDIISHERAVILNFQKKAENIHWFTLADLGIEREIKEGLNRNIKQMLFALGSGALNLLGQGIVGRLKFAKMSLTYTRTTPIKRGFRKVTTISDFDSLVKYHDLLSPVTYYLPDGLRITFHAIEGTKQGVALAISHSLLDKFLPLLESDPDTLKLFEAPTGSSSLAKGLCFAGDILTDMIPGNFGALSTVLKMLLQTLASLYAWRRDLEHERRKDHNWHQHKLNETKISMGIGLALRFGCTELAWGNNFNSFEQLAKVLRLTHLMWGRE